MTATANIFESFVVIMVVIVALAGTAACAAMLWAGWHAWSPTGYLSETKREVQAIKLDHLAGAHERVIARYESPIEVWLGPDETLAWRNDNPQDLLFMVGESYHLTGDHDAARLHFLRVIGWSQLEYEAYCRLDFTDCSDPGNLRNMAAVHNAVEAR